MALGAASVAGQGAGVSGTGVNIGTTEITGVAAVIHGAKGIGHNSVSGLGPGVWGAAGSPASGNPANIGTVTDSTSATVTLTGVTVPAGSLIVVVVTETVTTSTPSVADGVNTYSNVYATSLAPGMASMFYAANAGLSSGTIT